jgi:nitrate/nitrite transporter NarK
MTMSQNPEYWFPAKRYGWGWGIPATWQGWVVMAAFLVLVVVGAVVVPPHREPVMFVGYIVVLSIALTAVCWWKGEPPRWRWGGD